jgi:hypothetical protein
MEGMMDVLFIGNDTRPQRKETVAYNLSFILEQESKYSQMHLRFYMFGFY